MIRGYSDHAANERTFLAWVRTAIAVMAFGFLVERFDLFLQIAAPSLADRALSLPGQRFGNVAGLTLIVVGTAMVAVAAIRFVRTAKEIDSEALHQVLFDRLPPPTLDTSNTLAARLPCRYVVARCLNRMTMASFIAQKTEMASIIGGSPTALDR